jgi:Holliday junction resolvasome RuvABC endonuclease subunit
VLGLDCSSNTIGWGIVSVNSESNEIQLLAHGHFKPPGTEKPELVRLNETYNKIYDLCETHKPNMISVEDIFLFMKGKSQARTITVLTAFNRVASLAAYRSTKNVCFYSVHQIRNIIKVCFKVRDTIQKEGVPDVIRSKLSKRFKDVVNTKNGVAKETFDEADGIAAAWAGALHILFPNTINPLLETKTKKKR